MLYHHIPTPSLYLHLSDTAVRGTSNNKDNNQQQTSTSRSHGERRYQLRGDPSSTSLTRQEDDHPDPSSTSLTRQEDDHPIDYS